MRRVIVTLMFSLAALGFSGCGEKPVPVNGIVTLDGKPVEGATVTFGTDDGKRSYGGFTDASGAFSLSGGGVLGALPGTYKVTVTKSKKIEGSDGMEAGNSDAMKQMEKMAKESKGSNKGPGGMMPGKMGPGMAPGGMMPGGGTGVVAPPKSELPSVYATMKSTTLTVTVPAPNLPITLELKSK